MGDHRTGGPRDHRVRSEKLPELARKAARVLNYLRRIGNDARGQLRKELGDEFADISLADLNPRTFVAKHLLSGDEVEDLRQIREPSPAARSSATRWTRPGARSASLDAPDAADATPGDPGWTRPGPRRRARRPGPGDRAVRPHEAT